MNPGQGPTQRAVLAVLQHGPATSTEIAARARLPPRAVRGTLKALRARGLATGSGPCGLRPSTWTLLPGWEARLGQRAPYRRQDGIVRDTDVLDSLRALGPTSWGQLARDTGRPPTSVWHALRRLLAAELVERLDRATWRAR
jgi:DNA-binding IclR family transcriptional regulator